MGCHPNASCTADVCEECDNYIPPRKPPVRKGAKMKPDLKQIRERCEAATPEPWYVGEDYYGGISVRTKPTPATNIIGENAIFENTGRGIGDVTEEDAEFIAHARQDIPSLLDEIERLKQSCLNIKDSAVLIARVRTAECENKRLRAALADTWRELRASSNRLATVKSLVDDTTCRNLEKQIAFNTKAIESAKDALTPKEQDEEETPKTEPCEP